MEMTRADVEYGDVDDNQEEIKITIDEQNKYSEHYSTKSNLKNCPIISIQIENKQISSDDTWFVKESIDVTFIGPNVFVKHSAYWVSETIDPCSDFKRVFIRDACWVLWIVNLAKFIFLVF